MIQDSYISSHRIFKKFLVAAYRKKLNLTMLFVAHELSVIEFMCEKVAVMYLGEIVEVGSKNEIFRNPKHPYTKKLIESIPKLPF